jgi:hypothetical protein
LSELEVPDVLSTQVIPSVEEYTEPLPPTVRYLIVEDEVDEFSVDVDVDDDDEDWD